MFLFEGDRGACRCYNCFYGFEILKLEDFNIYRDEGIDISDGMKITPSLIDRVFKVCHKTFRAQYYLEPQSLKDLCMGKIAEEKDLNLELLPSRLADQCLRFRQQQIPLWNQEWTIPSLLIRHLNFNLKFTPRHEEF